MKKLLLLTLSFGLATLPALAFAQSKYIKEANTKVTDATAPALATTTTDAGTTDAGTAGRTEPAKVEDAKTEDSAEATDASGESDADTATREGASTPQR